MAETRHYTPDEFPVGCVVTNPDRGIRYANAYLLEKIGCGASDVLGRDLLTFMSKGSQVIVEMYILPLVMDSGFCEEIQIALVSSDGNSLPMIVNASLDRDSGDIHWSMVFAAERDKLYQELVTARKVLEERATRLEVKAATDYLTDLINRGELERYGQILVGQAERIGRPLAFLMIDIDHFKEVNDHFGHQAGDRVIQQLGTLLQQTSRSGDVVARFGGEEFVILLADSTVDHAEEVATRVLHQVQELDTGVTPISVSIGAVSAEFDGSLTFSDLLEAADRALYEAKTQGRNRVIAREVT